MAVFLLVAGVKLLGGLAAWLAVPAESAARPSGSLPEWLHAVHLLVFAGCGVLLIAGGRVDRRSRTLGAIFVLFASVFADPLLDTAAVSSGGGAYYAHLASALQPAAFIPFFLWRFAEVFPVAQSPLSFWLRPALFLRASAVAGTILFAAGLASIPASRGWWSPLSDWLSPRGTSGNFWLVVSLLIVPALVFVVSKIGNALPGERRRLRVFVAGLLIGTGPLALDLILSAAIAPYDRYFMDPGHRRALAVVHSLFVLTMAAITVYAVVVDRVLDVRFIVRRAIQYALARYTAIALMVVPVALLVLHLYRNRELSVADVFAGSARAGWWALLALAVALMGVRRRLLTGIDRRFFREQYDMRRILSGLAKATRTAHNSRELARLVAAEVDRALHVERISVLLRDESTGTFRDPHGATSPLPSSSSLATLVGGAGSPLDVHLSSPVSPLQRLPGPEREWLADAGAQMLVPFLGSHDQLLGILVMGDKLSDAPFSDEDRMLLTAAVSSAALSLEHLQRLESGGTVAPADDAVRPAVQCVRCATVSEYPAGSCGQCHGPVAPALLPSILHGKFRVERQLGAGGMGVVYLAHDLELDRRVALKTLPRVSPEEAASLRREARSMASLEHANLAIIYGSEVWRGLPILVLEFLPGGTLGDRIGREPLGASEIVAIGVAMAGALAHLHRSGLLHGDVKPSNIGFSSGGVAKLLDFGLARLVARMPAGGIDSLTTGGEAATESLDSPVETVRPQLVGTPAYMSPEALAMTPPEPSFDLWSLSVSLFEATAGRHPFAAQNVYETVRRITVEGAPDLCDLVPDCRPGLARFFRLSLARERQHRPSSANEYAAALLRIAGEA